MNDIHETVYEHDSTRKDAFTVSASERWSINMIKRLKQRFPDEIEITAENADGSIVAHIPLAWMRIVPKRHTNLTDEKKTEFAARMSDYRNNGSTEA